ncbi:MAG: hypothetical protein ACREL5_05370 [Gemmatimonadales bacterium]
MTASRTRAMTVLAIAFALGLIVGGASLAMAARSGRANWLWRGRRPQATYGARLQRVLKLEFEPTQRDSITAVWCRGRAAIDSIQQQLRPPVESLFEQVRPAIETRRQQTRTEIRALLTAPQRDRYDSLNRALDDQRRKMRDQGGPPPSGSPPGPCPGGGPGQRGGKSRGSF